MRRPGLWRLHRLLHGHYLRRYRSDADGLAQVFDTGEYNCLSATLLYGLAAARLGLEPEILETPGHLAVRLHAGARVIDIETTSPRGFDIGRYQRGTESEEVAPVPEAPSWSGLAPAPEFAPRLVPLDAAVGIAWLNEAWRLLERGRTPEAVRRAVAAGTWVRGQEGLEEDVRVLFETGWRIADDDRWPNWRWGNPFRAKRDAMRAAAVAGAGSTGGNSAPAAGP